MTQKFEHYPD